MYVVLYKFSLSMAEYNKSYVTLTQYVY